MIQAALEVMRQQNDSELIKQGLGTLHRLLINIVQFPQENKYRFIKRSVAKIEQTLFSLKGNLDILLQACGFVEVAPQEFCWNEGDFTVLNSAIQLIDQVLQFQSVSPGTRYSSTQQQITHMAIQDQTDKNFQSQHIQQPIDEYQKPVYTQALFMEQKKSEMLEPCHICGKTFKDPMLLIEHVQSHNQQQPQQKKSEVQKCPHCFQRFAVSELPTHIQQDHYI